MHVLYACLLPNSYQIRIFKTKLQYQSLNLLYNYAYPEFSFGVAKTVSNGLKQMWRV